MTLVAESRIPSVALEEQTVNTFIDPDIAAELTRVVAYSHPDADSIADTTHAVWSRHLAETEVLPYSRVARIADKLGRIASWPMHVTGIHDTPRWLAEQARENAELTQSWALRDGEFVDNPANSWQVLGVQQQPFKAAYFNSDQALTTDTVNTSYHELTDWLRKHEPQTRNALLDRLGALEARNVSVTFDQLVKTPIAVQARVRMFENVNGDFHQGFSDFIRHGIRPILNEEAYDSHEEHYQEAVSNLKQQGETGHVDPVIGRLALSSLEEIPNDSLDLLTATADISLEVQGRKRSGELSEADKTMIQEINEMLAPAKLALAAERFEEDYQKEEISQFGNLLFSTGLVGLGLTGLQKFAHVKDAVLQFLAGGLDDVASFGGIIRKYWHNIKEMPKEVYVPAAASGAAATTLYFATKLINGLAANAHVLAHLGAGGIFEAGALGIAAAGSWALSFVRGKELRGRANKNLTSDFIAGVDAETITKLRKPKELSTAEAKAIVMEHIQSREEFSEMNENDLLKLQAATNTKAIKKLITPPRFPRLTYANKAFHDTKLQPLFSRAQQVALVGGVGVFVLFPHIAGIPLLLAGLGSSEGFITKPLHGFQQRIPKALFNVRRTAGRILAPPRSLFHKTSETA